MILPYVLICIGIIGIPAYLLVREIYEWVKEKRVIRGIGRMHCRKLTMMRE